METTKNHLYALMLVAAAAVIVLSLAGIAAITGMLPISASGRADVNNAPARQDCYRCGVIESVWSMDESRALPEREESKVRYAVRVFMEDGNYRTLYYSEPPLFQTGERVKVSDGTLVLRVPEDLMAEDGRLN
jgi:hypothetical protein